MKFNRHKKDHLTLGDVVEHELAVPDLPDAYPPVFSLLASREGVLVRGAIKFESNADLQAFAKALSDAWKDHLSLKPKIVTSLAGH